MAKLAFSCVGARPSGMRGGFIAIADNQDAVYWNPAGLIQLKKPILAMTFTLTGKDQMGYRHNLVYGLFIYLFGEGFWEGIGLADEPFFFIIAIFVCPILFLVGTIGNVVLFIKERKRKS